MPPCPAEARPFDPQAASVAQLLAKILGPSADRVCESLPDTWTDLNHVAAAHPAELQALGFAPSAVDRIAAVIEFAKRFGEREFRQGQPFRAAADIFNHFREHLGSERVEHFYAVLLDNKHRKLRDVLLSKGSLTAAVVHPRDAYVPVIRYSAAAVLFVHNHPSGDPTPSQEDIAITRRLREVGELIGVRVLDHIIIGQGRYVSFVDDGYWSGAPYPAHGGGIAECDREQPALPSQKTNFPRVPTLRP